MTPSVVVTVRTFRAMLVYSVFVRNGSAPSKSPSDACVGGERYRFARASGSTTAVDKGGTPRPAYGRNGSPGSHVAKFNLGAQLDIVDRLYLLIVVSDVEV